MTTRRPSPTVPRPAAVAVSEIPPAGTDIPVPIPGTPPFAQGLSDWVYGPTPPTTPDEHVLWRQYYQTHVGLLPPAQREPTRRAFKPARYPQTINQHGTLAGILSALLVMQLAPRVIPNTDIALLLPLPLAAVIGFGAMYLTREYLWAAWTRQFRALGINGPARPKRQTKGKKRT